MKKKYMEPQMIVEDFSVSEMIAANCGISVNRLRVVTQTNGYEACDNGTEPYWCEQLPGAAEGVTKGTMYGNFSSLYEGTSAYVGDDDSTDQDYLFTEAYFIHSGRNDAVCSTDPIKDGVTFGNVDTVAYECDNDTTLLQNS